MIDTVRLGTLERTVEAAVLCALTPGGVIKTIAVNPSTGGFGGSTGPLPIPITGSPAINLGGKVKTVRAILGVAKKSDGTLAIINCDSNQNLK